MFTVNAGAAFFTPPEAPGGRHLFFVLTSVSADGHVVIVNVTSSPNPPDGTCSVERGDHPGVTRQCYAYYAEARIVKASHLRAIPSLRPTARASADLVRRLCSGAIASPYTPREVLDFLHHERAP